ncbi:Zn-dependent protease with chaperone function [Granulicella rosea]|uniref:Zn-dependent protease with chaperone function n=1 Tax=Granulicella rosea TaxID=474952 RepID=A0A239MCR0_9BACT|nr:M48 family metalloprotease [Granulicella rosea]SNT39933.1 Zn-dependent protease with chaperone function [Granulicella rosea]
MKFLVRSLLVLFALYGMVFAIGDVMLVSHQLSLWWGIVFSVAVIGLQFATSPWVIEHILSIDWAPDALPEVNRAFVEQLCRERGLPQIQVGVIYSGTPNAFAFGRVRSDAKVVVTEGLLKALTPEEANAVLAHEIGHIEHYDFAVMAVAALAPLLLYQIYVWTSRVRNGGTIAWTAYACYWIGQFLVLTLNRTREYHADHYAAMVTRAPGELSSALVKIAYGMIRADGEYKESLQKGSTADKSYQRAQHQLGSTIALMGIANLRSSESLAVAIADPARAAAVMRWDLVNPWARFYELNSTHPLTALRVRALNAQSTEMHQQIAYPLPAGQASDRKLQFLHFPLQFVIWAGPWVFGLLWLFSHRITHQLGLPGLSTGWLLIGLGATWTGRIAYRYHGSFKPAAIGDLLEDTEVSQMKPRAVELRGEIVGNGMPGYYWSADLVLRDDSGMVFLLYRSSIPFARFFFAITDAGRFIGEKVTVTGWYRRGLRPYVELSQISGNLPRMYSGSGPISMLNNKDAGERELVTHRSYSRWIQGAGAAIATAAGLVMLFS